VPRDKKTEPGKPKILTAEQIASLPELTDRQHAFMMGILDGLTATESYRRAYPTSQTWNSDNALWVEACRLRADPKVSLWLKAVRQQESHSAIATLEQHTARLEGLATRAEQSGNYGAAVQAEKARGQASGLYVDRNETRITADEDLVKVIKDLALIDPALARVLAADSGLESVVDATVGEGDNLDPPVSH